MASRPPTSGPPDIITRAELADELRSCSRRTTRRKSSARDNLALRALGLLEPDQDVAELQLQLLGDRVLGFYDDGEKRMVVVSDAGLDVEARITYAHEYTHALQDAAFGIDSLQTDAVGEDDRGLARTALIEGDATVTMLAWMFQHLTPQEIHEYLVRAPSSRTPPASRPGWSASSQFPYNEGLTWAPALAGGDPSNPDFTEVDAAFTDPPDSTEQIMDLEKWDGARGAGARWRCRTSRPPLGDGWERGRRHADRRRPPSASCSSTSAWRVTMPRRGRMGWGGDRAVIATGPDDAFAVAWRLAWDSPADATDSSTPTRSSWTASTSRPR